MKGNKQIFSKRNIIILSIILFTILTVKILWVLLKPMILPLYFCFFMLFLGIQEGRMQEQVLCKTDHQALLEACRTLSKQVLAENPISEWVADYMIVPDSELSKYTVIRDIGAHQVTVSDVGIVTISAGGTMWHFGVRAYPECFKPSYNDKEKELVPGLWYYDDRYNRYKDYDKDIERLLQKRRK